MNETMIQFYHWYSKGDITLWKKVQAKYLSELELHPYGFLQLTKVQTGRIQLVMMHTTCLTWGI